MAGSSDFWSWFLDNCESLTAIVQRDTPENLRRQLYETLNDRFVAAYPDIVVEVGPADEGALLVVTADGDRSAFASVIACVAQAPVAPGWTVVAFRPRGPADFGIAIFGVDVEPSEIRLALEPAGETVDVVFLLRSEAELDDGQLGQIAYIMLDGLLGEWDVETHVGAVRRQILDPERDWPSDALEFGAARDEFDRLVGPYRRPN